MKKEDVNILIGVWSDEHSGIGEEEWEALNNPDHMRFTGVLHDVDEEVFAEWCGNVKTLKWEVKQTYTPTGGSASESITTYQGEEADPPGSGMGDAANDKDYPLPRNYYSAGFFSFRPGYYKFTRPSGGYVADFFPGMMFIRHKKFYIVTYMSIQSPTENQTISGTISKTEISMTITSTTSVYTLTVEDKFTVQTTHFH